MSREHDEKHLRPRRTWPMGYSPRAAGPAGGMAPRHRRRAPCPGAPGRRVAKIALGLVTLALAACGGGPAATPAAAPAATQAVVPAASAPPTASGAPAAPPTPAVT